MFRGKCGFCRQPGHNVAMCDHRDKQIVIDGMESEIYRCESKYEIKQYLKTLSRIRLELLCSQVRIPSGTPLLFIRNQLTDYYYANILIRNMRLRRAEDDADVHLYTQRLPLPYTLFRQCVNTIQEICSAFSLLKSRFMNQHTRVPQNIQETDVFHRGWKIIPELNVSDLNSDLECPICLDKTTHINYVLPLCKHGVCSGCFVKMVDSGSIIKAPICPMCRENIHTVDVFNVSIYNTIANKYIE